MIANLTKVSKNRKTTQPFTIEKKIVWEVVPTKGHPQKVRTKNLKAYLIKLMQKKLVLEYKGVFYSEKTVAKLVKKMEELE